MKTWIFVLVFIVCPTIFGQVGFTLPDGVKKEAIPFQLVNYLPIISVKINGKISSFILDSGVKSSIYFSLTDSDRISFKNTSAVILRGLGPKCGIGAVRSTNNRVEVGKAKDKAHSLFIIFDTDLNLSPRMGIPIHGILGNDFFENFIVSIDYTFEKIIIYDLSYYNARKKCKRCKEFPLQFSGGKPYLTLKVFNNNHTEDVTLLIDSGSSDVLWLFDRKEFINDTPKNYFDDFLGLGLSGDIYGKRTQIDSLALGEFLLKKVIVAFPNEEAISKARTDESRDGSIGGGFLSRFKVIYDYGNNKILFKKNRNFTQPFNYNMSGLTFEHQGMELVINKQLNTLEKETMDVKSDKSEAASMQILLVPKYVVVDVRSESPADEAGIKIGDTLISLNGKPSYRYKLYQILGMFSKEEGGKMRMEIEREEIVYKLDFILKNPIP